MKSLVIEKMSYWHENKKSLYGATVTFKNNLIEIYLLSLGEYISEEISQEDKYIRTPDIQDLCNGYQTIYFNSDVGIIATKPEQTETILDYYIKYNNEVKEQRKIKSKVVNEIANDIEAETNYMSLNFISMVPEEFFLHPDIIIFMSGIWSYEDYDIESGDTDIEGLSELIIMIMEKFEEYSILLMEDYNINDDITQAVTWKLVLNACKEYFTQEYIEKLGLYMGVSLSDVASVDEFIDIYCKCPEIDSLVIENLSLLTYYLMYFEAFEDSSYFPICYNNLSAIIINKTEKIKRNTFKNTIKGIKKVSDDNETFTIDDIDMMNGNEFEHFICKMYTKMGYKAEVTKQSGDQGLDIIAEKNGNRFGVQAKCYSSTVGNSAIQEAVAGMNYYNCDKVIVVTNNSFTNSAVELAKANDVVLWDRSILKEKIAELF